MLRLKISSRKRRESGVVVVTIPDGVVKALICKKIPNGNKKTSLADPGKDHSKESFHSRNLLDLWKARRPGG